jgi:outer membrane lipoprotein SlyB
MKKKLFILSTACLSLASSSVLTSCDTTASGALVGGAAGAGLGAIAGNNIHGLSKGEGALIGGAAGALIGGAHGRQQQQINQTRNEANTQIVNVRNSNGSTTPVTLVRQGSQWQGPRGEMYNNLPSQGQLSQSYGF